MLGLLSTGFLSRDQPVSKATPAKVVVIPIRGQIAKPELYILRRGLKEAIEDKVDTIVLDMETPGGSLEVTFDMLKALGKFPGKTVTYINREAISAGALISAGTDEIYFAPDGIIGAAAPVLATGIEIESTMRGKIVSYLKARVRSMSEGKGYRGEVISAMIDMESELKIGDEVIKQKGELLSLTAQEAVKTYGDPPQPLLGAGIAETSKPCWTGSMVREIIRSRPSKSRGRKDWRNILPGSLRCCSGSGWFACSSSSRPPDSECLGFPEFPCWAWSSSGNSLRGFQDMNPPFFFC